MWRCAYDRYGHSREPSETTVVVSVSLPCRSNLLLHPELDGLDWIERIHGTMPRLAGVDQSAQHVEPIGFGRAASGTPQPLRFGEPFL